MGRESMPIKTNKEFNMFTVTPAATAQFANYFESIEKAPIRVYYSSGG
jgi:hypothetical protein